MSVDLLKEAQEALSPRGVFLRDMALEVKEGFFPRTISSDDSLAFRIGHAGQETVVRFGTDRCPSPVNNSEGCVLVFRYDLSLDLTYTKDKESMDSGEDFEKLMSLMATFEAEYLVLKDVSEAATGVFLQRNVIYHVWPYWREIVQSACGRIGMPVPIPVPHFHVNNSK